jgi:DNA-binding XRE family transcriptional regulator
LLSSTSVLSQSFNTTLFTTFDGRLLLGGFTLEAKMRLLVAHNARLHRDWNMRQLADALGIEHQTVMYWNQGRAVPRLPMLVRLARLLHCSLDDFIPKEVIS